MTDSKKKNFFAGRITLDGCRLVRDDGAVLAACPDEESARRIGEYIALAMPAFVAIDELVHALGAICTANKIDMANTRICLLRESNEDVVKTIDALIHEAMRIRAKLRDATDASE
ncbi:MAG: hypothetical protein ACTHKB_11540 [Burkholderiaceae bacterium]